MFRAHMNMSCSLLWYTQAVLQEVTITPTSSKLAHALFSTGVC
jgi:hypothetical protein